MRRRRNNPIAFIRKSLYNVAYATITAIGGYKMTKRRKNTPRSGRKRTSSAQVLVLAVLICILGFLVYSNATLDPDPKTTDSIAAPSTSPDDISVPTDEPGGSQTPENTPDETQAPEAPLPEFNPYQVDSTNPNNLFTGTGIQVDGVTVDSYSAADSEKIDFGMPEDYTSLEGVITFRGNNFRNSASYGFANLTEHQFGSYWTVQSSALTAPDGYTWTGSGWVGQPLIVKWPKETRQIMNMYDWAKEKDELVEVIYATMDGNVYFIELESGSKTRDTLVLGYTFKGAGALDPRGYPILYLGSGYNSNRGSSRAFVVSLIDGSIMYEFGNGDGFALRQWPMFDGSPLVDAETDQLIYPSENGVLYIIKLNTVFDQQSGTISVNPSKVVKWRYNGVRTGGAFWLGMEDSPIVWRGHIIMADNGGNLMCVNLNTLETVWVQDVLDDTNCTPVLELEDGHPYVYISTSFHAGWRAYAGQAATIPIWKIDAVTGEIVWHKDYQCYTVDGTSGGVQGTLAIGEYSLSDLIFVPVARTPTAGAGLLVAINKQTGEEVWQLETNVYSWSSPVAIYDEDGRGYIIYCTSGGYMYLLDGLTGNKLDSVDLGSNTEASPAVYENKVVVGTRGQLIWGITIN